MCVDLDFTDTPACHIDPAFAIYRKTTLAVLRKYLRMSMELGHLPSLLGKEFFRSHVTSYHTFTFEDVVIFTYDVELCLGRLPEKLQAVIARVVFQEYTQQEAAELIGCSLMSVRRWYTEAIDRLTEIFMRNGVLEPIKLADMLKIASELGDLGEAAIPSVDESDEPEVHLALPPKKGPMRGSFGERPKLKPLVVKCG